MSEPLKIDQFKGMNNVDPRRDVASPHVIHNLDVTQKGVLSKRAGYVKIATLVNAHSLFAFETDLYCFAEGSVYTFSLWRVSQNGDLTEVGEIVSDNVVYSVKLENFVYLASKSWLKILNITTGVLRDWGVAVPTVAPIVTVVSGSLPAGAYKLCFTTTDAEGRMSGAGPITSVELASSGKIAISNTAGYDVWITDTNGSEFYYAGNVSSIEQPVDIDILPTLLVRPPEPMEHVVFWNGRIWGSIGKDVVYSEPFAYEWFKDENFLPFEDDIVMIADSNGGLFIGTKTKTYFVDAELNISTVDNVGVVTGTLTKTSFTKLGQDIPVWVTQKGIVAGVEGKVVYLTVEKVKFDVGAKGASIFTRKKGMAKLMTSMEQPSSVGFGDSVTAEVIRNGKVINVAEFQRDQQDDMVLSESVVDEVV